MSRTIREITNQAMDASCGGGSGSRRVCGRCGSGNTYMLVSRRLQCCKTCGAASKEDSNSWMPYVFEAGIHKGKDIDSVATEYLDRVISFTFVRKSGYRGPWLRVRDFARVEKERRQEVKLKEMRDNPMVSLNEVHPKYGDEPPFAIEPLSSLPVSKETEDYLDKIRGEINERMGVRPEYLDGPKGKTLNILETGRIPAKKVPVIEKDRRTMCSSILWR